MGNRHSDPSPGLAKNSHAQIIVVVEEGHALVGVEEEAGEEAGDGGGFARGVGVNVRLAQVEGRGQAQGRQAGGMERGREVQLDEWRNGQVDE